MPLKAIQGHLRASIAGRAQRVGPFLVMLQPDTASAGRNWPLRCWPTDVACCQARPVAPAVMSRSSTNPPTSK